MEKAKLLLLINDNLSAINVDDIKLPNLYNNIVIFDVLKVKLDDTLLEKTISKGYDIVTSMTLGCELHGNTFSLFIFNSQFWNSPIPALAHTSTSDCEKRLHQNIKKVSIKGDKPSHELNILIEKFILETPFCYFTKTGNFSLKDYMNIQKITEKQHAIKNFYKVK